MLAPKIASTKMPEGARPKAVPRAAPPLARAFGGPMVEQALMLQRTVGNQAMQRLLGRRPSAGAPRPFEGSSPSLLVGDVNDHLEHEADRAATHAMQDAASAPSITKAPRGGDRVAGEGAHLQRTSAVGPTPAGEASETVRDVLRGPGQPLDPESRAFMDARFGKDFGDVRIHADARAAESARALGARAYTVGQQVVFGRGQYSPGTADGRRLLAHELVHTLQQRGGAPMVQRAPDPSAPAPAAPRPALEARLKIIEETGPAVASRLGQIIRTGGQVPIETKVIAAAIIDVKGYNGPKEMRAISGANTDALGQGAPVYHASSPSDRTLSATRSIAGSGPRKEFPFAHINDAEMKIFEDIIGRLPKDAEGTIQFTTMRVRQGVLEPYPACSGCIRASFEAAGRLPKIDIVSHAPVHPTGTAPVVDPADPKAPASGQKPAAGPGADEGGGAGHEPAPAPKAGAARGLAIGIGTGIATLGVGLLSAYLKAKVDQKIAAKQLEAFLALAKQKINQNPDKALSKMMFAPEITVYAWIYLDSAVITTFEANSGSLEPTTNDSSPILNLSRIEFQYFPVPKELADTFSGISGGGHHITTVRTIIVDIPLQTPPIEDMFVYADAHKLPLNGLLDYAMYRLQKSMIFYEEAVRNMRDVPKYAADTKYWQAIVDRILKSLKQP